MKQRKGMTKMAAFMCVAAMLALTGCDDEEVYSDSGYEQDSEYAADGEYAEESGDYEGGAAASSGSFGSGNLGSAGELAGRTAVVSIFANDNTTTWEGGNEQLKYDSLQYIGMAADWISQQAAQYGCNAEFIYDWTENQDLYFEGDVNGTIANEGDDMDSSAWEFIANNIDSNAIAANYQADNVIYMMILNTPEDQSITSSTRNYYEGMEYPYEVCFMYCTLDGQESGPAMYAHEMLHTFGAPDLYAVDTYGDNYGITDELVQSYTNSNSNDIMFTVYDGGDASGVISYDSITNDFTELDAYYVGLTSQSSEAESWGLQPSQH